MLLTLASFLLPPLFVFGVYHLLTWFNVFRINERVFWKRVAITSAICHVLLVSGFFAFSYIDAGNTTAFGIYLFNRSNFWRLMTIFDTAPMLVIIGLLAGLDRAGVNPPGLVAITVAITYIVGSVQWFFVGGGVGALLERFFEGLKTPEPEDDEWM
ncbi:MAG: hypothetical protein DMG14_25765 [Acidobacteria bacterium]|nr:MAG: hypothetical protein DMG14_25765 [Acidobacteriota bacterium]